MATRNSPFTWTDHAGITRTVALPDCPTQDERESAAAEARANQRAADLKRAIRAMYEAGERREMAKIIRSMTGDDLREVFS